MTKRIALATFLFTTALGVWACESTDEKPDAPVTAVDMDTAKAACAGGGLDDCRAYADAALRANLTRPELVSARDELAIYCTVDEPAVCQAVRALAFRIDQPRFDGEWAPVTDADDDAEVLVESPRRARYVNAAPGWLAEGRVKMLGAVTLEIDVRRDGEIHAMRVVDSVDPVLDRMTMEAALDNRYLPARVGIEHRDATLRYTIDWGGATASTSSSDAGPEETKDTAADASGGDAGSASGASSDDMPAAGGKDAGPVNQADAG